MSEDNAPRKELFTVEVEPDTGKVVIVLDATPGASFAASIAKKLLKNEMVGYQRGPRNRAFEALAHQIGQGSMVCEGVDANGEQVGPERAAETFPALQDKVYFGSDDTASPTVQFQPVHPP